jgi:hypothetical protein
MSIDRLAEGALSELLDASPDGVVMAAQDGTIEYANHTAERLFGYGRDELVGMSIERLLPDQLRERHVRDRSAYLKHPRSRPMGLGLRLQALHRDGAEVPVEISLAPVSLGDGTHTVATVRDATEQRKLEGERMRYARAHAVEEIVAALDVIVWESAMPDRDMLTYLGGRPEMLLGYARAQWLEPGFWASAVHPEDRLTALTFAEAAREKERFELQYRMTTAAGELRHVRDIVTVQRNADGTIGRLRGVITDITERRQIVERVGQAQKMEAVGQLAGGIAHDFNNLVTIVSGYAQRLAERPELADAREDVEHILSAADRAGELTRQLLAFARRGTGSSAQLDAGALIDELEPMLRRLLAADIALEITIATGLPPVTIDRAGLEQIVMNLVINASDAMPAGGMLRVTLDEVDAGVEEAKDHGLDAGTFVRCMVADSGDGLPEGIAGRIFEPFFTTKGVKGTGMGLATVNGMVEQAGGWIDVASVPGVGATFIVMLPVAEERVEAVEPPTGPGAPGTVLLVEDEPALRRLVVTMLEDQGYTVLQAGNGHDAIAVADRHRGDIDLLLTDIVMPRLSGPELAAQLRGLRPGLEVLFMSGYNDSRLLSRGVEESQVNLLVKPFTPDQLVARVAELLAAPPP